MANLFAYRSTDPEGLTAVADPIGPRNDLWLSRLASQATKTIAMWGGRGGYLDRDVAVLEMIAEPYCIGTTKHGMPRHPLYMPACTTPVPFLEAVRA